MEITAAIFKVGGCTIVVCRGSRIQEIGFRVYDSVLGDQGSATVRHLEEDCCEAAFGEWLKSAVWHAELLAVHKIPPPPVNDARNERQLMPI